MPELQPSPHPQAAHLLTYRDRLLHFAQVRLDDPALAEDVVQESLLKALRAAPDFDDEERLTAWLFRVVRNAVIDAYRRRQREAAALERLARELEPMTPDVEAALCACYEDLLPTLKPEYADLITSVELGGESPEAAAERLGITRNNLKVRRHRARQQLRQRLDEACRTCAQHGCLDCSCTSNRSA